MIGIRAALTGYIGKDAEIRSTRDGKALSFPVAVDIKANGEAPAIWGAGVPISAIPWAPWPRGFSRAPRFTTVRGA